jgi:hypothetical protein
MLANPPCGALRGYATKLRDASKRGSRAAFAASAGDLDSNAVGGKAMRVLEGGPCILRAERQPEVRPAKPSGGPRSRGRRLSEEIEPPFRPRLGWGVVTKTASA